MDRTLEQAVLSALYLDPLINAARIVVRVHDGVVTLIGEVDTHAQKLAAKYKAECVPGVKEVSDELEVGAEAATKSRPRGNDIVANVLNALYWDLAVPPDRVCATCEQGWVTLTGEVDRPYQKSSAEADVRKIRGVVGVTNEIKVGSSGARKVEAPARAEPILVAASMRPIPDDRKATAERRAPH
jgi:osmotically-inducible protein OsmY